MGTDSYNKVPTFNWMNLYNTLELDEIEKACHFTASILGKIFQKKITETTYSKSFIKIFVKEQRQKTVPVKILGLKYLNISIQKNTLVGILHYQNMLRLPGTKLFIKKTFFSFQNIVV